MEKVAKFFNNAKSIYAFMFAISVGMYNIAILAADQRYVQISDYETNQINREIRQINGKIAELKIRLQYATKQRQKDMLQQLIIEAEKDKDNLKGE